MALVGVLDILYVQLHRVDWPSAPPWDVAPLQALARAVGPGKPTFPRCWQATSCYPRPKAPVKVLLAGAIVVTDVAGDDQLGAHYRTRLPAGPHHAPSAKSCKQEVKRGGLNPMTLPEINVASL